MLWLGRGPLCHWLVIQPCGSVLISLSPQFSHLEDGTSDNVSPGLYFVQHYVQIVSGVRDHT